MNECSNTLVWSLKLHLALETASLGHAGNSANKSHDLPVDPTVKAAAFIQFSPTEHLWSLWESLGVSVCEWD